MLPQVDNIAGDIRVLATSRSSVEMNAVGRSNFSSRIPSVAGDSDEDHMPRRGSSQRGSSPPPTHDEVPQALRPMHSLGAHLGEANTGSRPVTRHTNAAMTVSMSSPQLPMHTIPSGSMLELESEGEGVTLLGKVGY